VWVYLDCPCGFWSVPHVDDFWIESMILRCGVSPTASVAVYLPQTLKILAIEYMHINDQKMYIKLF
jgi:hypothetical protein